MKRLVKNGKIILDGTDPLYVKEEQALRKLEELENIEEELGIELGVFVKLYTTGCWGLYREEDEDYGSCCYDVLHFPPQVIKVNSKNNDLIILTSGSSIDNGSIEVFRKEVWTKYKLTDYNKTWALTKEELL